MAKGYEQSKLRKDALSRLGKALVRRSNSRCELCDIAGVKLTAFEVPPLNDEPVIEHCLFICDTCSSQIDNPKKIDVDHWRCLNSAMWSTTPVVQVVAITLLKYLADNKTDWAGDLLEQVYLEPEQQQWLDQVQIPITAR